MTDERKEDYSFTLLEATNKIYLGNGRRVRGFLGIELLVKPNSF